MTAARAAAAAAAAAAAMRFVWRVVTGGWDDSADERQRFVEAFAQCETAKK